MDNRDTKYHIALLLDAEPVLVALSYGKRTRVERITGLDNLSTASAVQMLREQGLQAVIADKDARAWASVVWADRENPDYGTTR